MVDDERKVGGRSFQTRGLETAKVRDLTVSSEKTLYLSSLGPTTAEAFYNKYTPRPEKRGWSIL